jgi:hypothetical protein
MIFMNARCDRWTETRKAVGVGYSRQVKFGKPKRSTFTTNTEQQALVLLAAYFMLLCFLAYSLTLRMETICLWNSCCLSPDYMCYIPEDRTLYLYLLIYRPHVNVTGSRESAVGIATGYWLDDRGVGVRVPVGSKMFTSPCSPDRFWGPPSFLTNGYGGLSPGSKTAVAWSWPLTSN